MSAISVIEEKIYTVEEYFELEKNSEVRHEYYYGKLIEMLGEAKKANKIAMNIYQKWINILEAKGFDIFVHDIKAEINPRKIYRYPDLVVTPFSDDEDEYVVKQPIIMAEVASHGSWKINTGVKLKEYTALKTLKYYLIVSQEEMLIQVCVRDGEQWYFEFFEEPNEQIEIKEFGLTISVSDIYNRVFANTKLDIYKIKPRIKRLFHLRNETTSYDHQIHKSL